MNGIFFVQLSNVREKCKHIQNPPKIYRWVNMKKSMIDDYIKLYKTGDAFCFNSFVSCSSHKQLPHFFNNQVKNDEIKVLFEIREAETLS